MLPVLSGGRRLPFPGGLGASSLLTGIVQAWRGCLTAGIVQAWRGARCLKTGKEQAPGPFPGARPDRSIVSPSYPGGPSWRKCGGLAVRSSWRSGPAPRRGSRSRASTAGGLVEPRGVEAWQLGALDQDVGKCWYPRASPRSRHGSSAGISAAWSDGRRGFRLSRGPRPGGLSSHGQPWPRRMNLTPLDPASGVSTGASLRIIGSGKVGGDGSPV
jgi:hypothetical protein